MTITTVEQAIESLVYYDKKKRYPKEEMVFLIEKEVEAIPALLAYLEELIGSREKVFKEKRGFGAIMVPLLLAYFGEKKAFPLLLKMIEGTEEKVEEMIGDFLTESFGIYLAETATKETYQDLIEFSHNKSHYTYSRLACLQALKVLMVQGHVSEADYRDILLEELDSDNEMVFTTSVVERLSEVRRVQDLPKIKKAFKDDRIDSVFISYDDVVNEPTWTKENFQERAITIEDELRWSKTWNCFALTKKEEAAKEKALQKMFKAASRNRSSGNEPVTSETIGRNQPCPCGSGKKYKKCCGKN